MAYQAFEHRRPRGLETCIIRDTLMVRETNEFTITCRIHPTFPYKNPDPISNIPVDIDRTLLALLVSPVAHGPMTSWSSSEASSHFASLSFCSGRIEPRCDESSQIPNTALQGTPRSRRACVSGSREQRCSYVFQNRGRCYQREGSPRKPCVPRDSRTRR